MTAIEIIHVIDNENIKRQNFNIKYNTTVNLSEIVHLLVQLLLWNQNSIFKSITYMKFQSFNN